MNRKVKEAIERYKSLESEIKKLKAIQDSDRELIKKYVSAKGTIRYDDVTCSCVTRTNIKYDVPEIIRRFKRKFYSAFIDDTVCFDTSFFVQTCKENGIDKSLFLQKGKYERIQAVNEKKLSALCDSGDIDIADLQGCYTAEESKTVSIRLPK